MAGLERMNQELYFGHAKFEMPVRHPNGDFKQAAEQVSRT